MRLGKHLFARTGTGQVDRGRREKRKRGERYVEAIEERSFVAALIWMTAKRGWALRVG